MRIFFSLTAADHQEFRRAYFSSLAGFWTRHHFKIFVAFGMVVIAAGLNWLFNVHREPYYGWACVVAGLYLVGRAVWLRFAAGRRWFSRNRHAFENVEVEIGESEVTARTGTETSATRWEGYRSYAETEGLLVLSMFSGSFLVLPKRAFSPADLDSFRALLAAKLPVVRGSS
jgi:YcxB-like protein